MQREPSPWQSSLTDRKRAAPGGRAPVCETHRLGLDDPAGPLGRSSLFMDSLGQEGSVSRNRVWVSFLGSRELVPLRGKVGQLSTDPTFFPSYQWRNRLRGTARGHTARWARTQASCPSSGLSSSELPPEHGRICYKPLRGQVRTGHTWAEQRGPASAPTLDSYTALRSVSLWEQGWWLQQGPTAPHLGSGFIQTGCPGRSEVRAHLSMHLCSPSPDVRGSGSGS